MLRPREAMSVRSSETESEPQLNEQLDLRGLVCTILHEYRERTARNGLGVTFVDEHPYAIVRADREAATAALRAIIERVAHATPRVVIVRLYSTDEELCIELSDDAIEPRGSTRAASDSTPIDISNGLKSLSADFEVVRRRLERSGASFRARQADVAAVFTIAFERAAQRD